MSYDRQKKVKLCKDCKWAAWAGVFMTTWRVCDHPKNLDPVEGSKRISCQTNRSSQGYCGPEGDLWEAKG